MICSSDIVDVCAMAISGQSMTRNVIMIFLILLFLLFFLSGVSSLILIYNSFFLKMLQEGTNLFSDTPSQPSTINFKL